MRCILPFVLDVPSITFQNKAFPLGAIKANIRDFDVWMCNKLVNCVFESNKNACNLYDKDLWGFSEGLTLSQSFHIIPEIFQCPSFDIVSISKEMIDHGYYVTGLCNELCVKGKASYKKYDYVHDYLIYGYDDDVHAFKAAGYMTNHRYEFYDLDYSDYYDSLKTFCFDRLSIHFHRININYQPKIDINKIKNNLIDYLFSKRDGKTENTENKYGIVIWDELKNQILNSHEKILDTRSFKVLAEHKMIMNKRLLLLAEKGILPIDLGVEYGKVVENAKLVYSLSIKYNVTNNVDLLSNMAYRIEKLCEQEISILSRIVEK